jgi:hypothetical protein
MLFREPTGTYLRGLRWGEGARPPKYVHRPQIMTIRPDYRSRVDELADSFDVFADYLGPALGGPVT